MHTLPCPCPQILRVHISSEDDPYFLHTLEVSEEEFQSLKAEQGILVDFANFPTKLISLLEKCLSSQASDMPRFQAVLSTHTSDSTFRVIETNDFKQLPHITLMFKPGNDFAVKQVGHQGATAHQGVRRMWCQQRHASAHTSSCAQMTCPMDCTYAFHLHPLALLDMLWVLKGVIQQTDVALCCVAPCCPRVPAAVPGIPAG
jgi:hypothetical protein